jgi:hypothetical protein
MTGALVGRDKSQAGQKLMFFFFSNRVGCLGSIVLSVIATIILLFFLGVFR